MPAGVDELIALLDLEQRGDDLFLGAADEHPPAAGLRRAGARPGAPPPTRTVAEDRIAHSLSAYFVSGLAGIPIEYHVEETRDGGSFSTRRLSATQDGRTIFFMACSFHRLQARPQSRRRHPAGRDPRPSKCPPLSEVLEKPAPAAPPKPGGRNGASWRPGSPPTPAQADAAMKMWVRARESPLAEPAAAPWGGAGLRLRPDPAGGEHRPAPGGLRRAWHAGRLDQPRHVVPTVRPAPTSGCSTARSRPRPRPGWGSRSAGSSPADAWSPPAPRRA